MRPKTLSPKKLGTSCFYTEKIENENKKTGNKKYTKLLSQLSYPDKKLKNKDIWKVFKNPKKFQKLSKKLTHLTRREIFQDVLPFFPELIKKAESTKDGCAENFTVEVTDTQSLDHSLTNTKKSMKELFNTKLVEKKGFKYNLGTTVTLKI